MSRRKSRSSTHATVPWPLPSSSDSPGEEWGADFDGVVFDGMRTCVNACIFCFMNMLPKESRSTLTIRDDDYRLSFLQGNFVTLTNMSDHEVDDAIDKMLSPMNVSLHAINPDCRRKLIGRNAARGIEVLERFLDAGIEIHAQIVLCPGINDGEELLATLEYVEAHPGITSLAIVPPGIYQTSAIALPLPTPMTSRRRAPWSTC